MTSHGFAGNYNTVTIGAAAALIVAANGKRRSVVIQNVHATQVLYLGDDTSVTTANGLKVVAGASVNFVDFTGPLYGIASGAGTDVRYFEVAGS